MTLDEEITAVEGVVDAASRAAAEHLERATKDLKLGGAALARYEDFQDATLRNARSTLSCCRELRSASASPAEASARVEQGLLASVREFIRLLYVVMVVLEQCAGSAPPG